MTGYTCTMETRNGQYVNVCRPAGCTGNSPAPATATVNYTTLGLGGLLLLILLIVLLK